MTGGSGTKGAAGVVDVTIMRTDRPAHGPLGSAGDTVVVIDVIRAFTTAAILLAGGVPHLTCVSDAGQARRLLGDAAPGHLVIGEQEDRPFTDVDLPNSPSAVLAAEVRDRPVVLFTANGTPALVRVPARATQTRTAVTAAADAHARRWGRHTSRAYWLGFLADVRICAHVNAVPVVLLGARDESGHVVLRRG